LDSNCEANDIAITNPQDINISLKYIAGTSEFYTPLAIGNISFSVWLDAIVETFVPPQVVQITNVTTETLWVNLSFNYSAGTGTEAGETQVDIFRNGTLNVTLDYSLNWINLTNLVGNEAYNFTALAKNSSGTNTSMNTSNTLILWMTPSAVLDNCTYVSGVYSIDCSLCDAIDVAVDLEGNNFEVKKSGTLAINENIINIGDYDLIGPGCTIDQFAEMR